MTQPPTHRLIHTRTQSLLQTLAHQKRDTGRKITSTVLGILLTLGVISLGLKQETAEATISTIYTFKDPEKTARFQRLITELRCPKCQNQNLADSNAQIAQDIKQRVYEQVQAGDSEDEITEYLIARYGEFITYRPVMRPGTWFLWWGPPGLLIVILAGISIHIYRRNQHDRFDDTPSDENPLDEAIHHTTHDTTHDTTQQNPHNRTDNRLTETHR